MDKNISILRWILLIIKPCVLATMYIFSHSRLLTRPDLVISFDLHILFPNHFLKLTHRKEVYTSNLSTKHAKILIPYVALTIFKTLLILLWKMGVTYFRKRQWQISAFF